MDDPRPKRPRQPQYYSTKQKDVRVKLIEWMHKELTQVSASAQIDILRCVCTLLGINAHFEGD